MLFVFFTVMTFQLMVYKPQWAPGIPLLGMYPKLLKTHYQKDYVYACS